MTVLVLGPTGQLILHAAGYGKLTHAPSLLGISTTGYPITAARPLNSLLAINLLIENRTGVPFDCQSGLQGAIGALCIRHG